MIKEVIETQAYVTESNRSPIMMIDGNKTRSLERTIKEVIGKHLPVLCDTRGYRGWGLHNNPQAIAVPSLSVSSLLPHAKKIKITVEIEDNDPQQNQETPTEVQNN